MPVTLLAVEALARAVLLRAVRDAADDAPVTPQTRADAQHFLTDPDGEYAESRAVWVGLAGYRRR